MSARFGRNQRRKMRESHAAELAMQAMLLRMNHAALVDESAALIKERQARLRLESELATWAQRIVNILGTDSAFARKLIEKGVDPSLFKLIAEGSPMRALIDPPMRAPMREEPMPLNMASKLIDLFSIHASAEIDTIAFRRRFLIRGPEGAVALMMDERTIYNLTRGGDDDLARYLLDAMITPWMAGKADRKRERLDSTSHADRERRFC